MIDASRRGFIGGVAAAGFFASPLARAAQASDAAAIHARVLKLDGHADVLLPSTPARYQAPGGGSFTTLERLRAGGINAIVLCAAASRGEDTPQAVAAARASIDEKLRLIRAFVRDHAAAVEQATTAADVHRIHAAGKIAVLTSFQNAYALGADLSAIDALVAQGVRVFGFNHVGNNLWADSSRPVGEPAVRHGGLSALGKAAVGRLNDAGVLIDVSQLTPDGVRQTIALSRAPVAATHSGAFALVQNPRNLSDEEIGLIVSKGGVIGATPFSSYLVGPTDAYTAKVRELRAGLGLPAGYRQPSDGVAQLGPDKERAFLDALAPLARRATLSDYGALIDYLVKRAGVDHVAIGTDFNHGAGITGFGDPSEVANVTAELVRRGYREPEIAKIWSGNFLRVLDAAQRLRRLPA